jgi:hypothetical protein
VDAAAGWITLQHGDEVGDARSVIGMELASPMSIAKVAVEKFLQSGGGRASLRPYISTPRLNSSPWVRGAYEADGSGHRFPLSTAPSF